jgi:hypothetical protein
MTDTSLNSKPIPRHGLLGIGLDGRRVELRWLIKGRIEAKFARNPSSGAQTEKPRKLERACGCFC